MLYHLKDREGKNTGSKEEGLRGKMVPFLASYG